MEKKRKMMAFWLFLIAVCSPVFSDTWKAEVVKSIDALVTSCVVVPCSFSHTGGNLPSSRLRAIWHYKESNRGNIYHEDSTEILDNFKGRTKLLGHMGQNNCTLEIQDIKDHDNGPFCFRAELVRTEKNEPTKDKYSFVEDCVELKMIHEPPELEMIHPKTAIQGHPFTVTCSVIHTCPSHLPKIKWSLATKFESIEHHKDISNGKWETQSILTFVPEEKHDHTDLTCTAEFNGGKMISSKTLKVYVKRTENYNHIIIPTVVGIGTAVIFGVLCIFVTKKYKRRIEALQSQDGSVWNRLSRLSRRIRSDGPGPSRSDQRRSIWSRLSRNSRPKRDISDFTHVPNNVNSRCSTDQKASKPRFPSPKSNSKCYSHKEDPDDGDYMNTADLNIYGNV